MNRHQRRRAETELRKRKSAVEKKIRLQIAQRACGPCQACCTTMAIAELDKAAGDACQNLCAQGCGIHKTRPASCRQFDCVWKMGLGKQSERPDLSGLLFDITRNEAVEQALVVREVKPGAFEDSVDMLQRLADEGHLLYLVKEEYRAIMGPPEKIARVREQAALVDDAGV